MLVFIQWLSGYECGVHSCPWRFTVIKRLTMKASCWIWICLSFLVARAFAQCRNIHPIYGDPHACKYADCRGLINVGACPETCRDCSMNKYLRLSAKVPCMDIARDCEPNLCSNAYFMLCRRTCNDCDGRKMRQFVLSTYKNHCFNYYSDHFCNRKPKPKDRVLHSLLCRKAIEKC